ncbi:MAG: hypothetical protein FRX48_02061 [Lasallia pustulata]|uniref:Life-span regulatory factor n=1 Tax=Lasallia pustulata TaxID=136370 RepID=A0A5M8PYC9_9LECA|nr:MAG: hypothetical protein FRX48_02061 [Lasallia pustulata]
MTSIHHAHRRTSPPNVKKTAVRAQRPTPLTRSASSRSVSKATKAKKQADVVVDDEVQDDGMATSFLQFCAMCEKQILVPNNSILYCSESCRRKDSSPPLTSTSTSNPYATILSSTPSPYTPSLSDPLGPKPKPLIPRLQPTILPPQPPP